MAEVQHTPFRLERVEAEWSHSFKTLDGAYFRILCCEGHVCGVAFSPSRAQLFLESPGLLEALKRLAADVEKVARDSFSTVGGDFEFDYRYEDPRGYAVWSAARAAIAKAEGRA